MMDEKESFAMSELEDVLLFRGVELASIQEILEDCSVRKLKSGEVLIDAGKANQCRGKTRPELIYGENRG